MTTTQGPAWMTVTGTIWPCSLKIWVIPSFLPMIPLDIFSPLSTGCPGD
jgi:hypothetical protein